MATQPRLLPTTFHLDRASKDAGRRGLRKARAALEAAHQRNVDRSDHDDHATAA